MTALVKRPFVQIEPRSSLKVLETFCNEHCDRDNCMSCTVPEDKRLLRQLIAEEDVN